MPRLEGDGTTSDIPCQCAGRHLAWNPATSSRLKEDLRVDVTPATLKPHLRVGRFLAIALANAVSYALPLLDGRCRTADRGTLRNPHVEVSQGLDLRIREDRGHGGPFVLGLARIAEGRPGCLPPTPPRSSPGPSWEMSAISGRSGAGAAPAICASSSESPASLPEAGSSSTFTVGTPSGRALDAAKKRPVGGAGNGRAAVRDAHHRRPRFDVRR